MPSYFPRHSIAWKVEEPPAFRRLTLSLVEMALITGVAMRLFRSLALTQGGSSWIYWGAAAAIGGLLFFGMATAHLGNYTVRQWVWRGPLFAVLETVGEMVTSLALILLEREPFGSGRAELADWPAIALDTLAWRLAALSLFTLVLAGVVQFVRATMIKEEHREHTLEAISEEIERAQGSP